MFSRYLLFLLCWCFSVSATESVETWIRDLAAENYVLREKAMKKLMASSPEILGKIKHAFKMPVNEEQKLRLERLMSHFGMKTELDDRLIRDVLEHGSTEDFLLACNFFPFDLIKGDQAGFQEEREIHLKVKEELGRNNDKESLYRFYLDIQKGQNIWIHRRWPEITMVNDIPFPKIQISDQLTDFYAYQIQRLNAPTRYETENTAVSAVKIPGDWQRLTGPDPEVARLTVDRRFVPGTHRFYFKAWDVGHSLPLLSSQGKRLALFKSQKIYSSGMLTVKIDAFDDISNMKRNQMRYANLALKANVKKNYEKGEDIDLLLTLLPYSNVHLGPQKRAIVIPDFSNGHFLTVFWRRVHFEGENQRKILEEITERLDKREKVNFFKDKIPYLTLYSLQSITRPLKIKAPERPGTWEMRICYGAFPIATTMSLEPFIPIIANNTSFSFPSGVFASEIYTILIK
jgi:hypothetical protein